MNNEFRYFIYMEEEYHGCYDCQVKEFKTVEKAVKSLENLLKSGKFHDYNLGLQLYKVKPIDLENFSLKDFNNKLNIHYFVDSFDGWYIFSNKQDMLDWANDIDHEEIIVYAGTPIKYSVKVQIES